MPGVKATVSIDGRDVAKLPAGAFTKVSLSPGRHRIGVKYPPLLGRKVSDYSLPGEPGLSYHLKLVDGGGPQRASGSAIANEFTQASARLMPMAAGDGLEYARRETYSPAR
ncbi:MAG: hypothetical protein JWO82_3958 [Akkermansiaceae bacterium]|nr:hypothetical protein [Akkermansiaceae bacterium]